MDRHSKGDLRRGWTTGACATAATKAALQFLLTDISPAEVTIVLPGGDAVKFTVARTTRGESWAMASIIKDAGDDPDVTHGAEIVAHVATRGEGGVVFRAGEGVGTVTKPGLPIAVGEPAINPVPRQMMEAVVAEASLIHEVPPNFTLTIGVQNGEAIAEKTWNPRLGIKGGLSILGTTGIVRPFSCSAWIASIHRGIDVARADGLTHVAGCTGATSERAVQSELGLPDHAMLDMGDFAGGMLKYLAKHPIERVTIGGGVGKLAKLAQGERDLHSSRSQVDFDFLAVLAGDDRVRGANTALEAVTLVPQLAGKIAIRAQVAAAQMVPNSVLDVIVVSRDGEIIGRSA